MIVFERRKKNQHFDGCWKFDKVSSMEIATNYCSFLAKYNVK
jgi:hypothetical protein